MTITTTTHLNFRGDARAALELYRSVFGGDLTIMTNQDAYSVEDPSEADQVKWGQVAADNGFRIMAFDVPASQAFDRGERSFFVSVRCDSADQIATFWKGLSDGATVVEELAASQWSPAYGMLTDRFGVTWVLDVATEHDGS